jgi:hypothetical protein
MAQASGIRLQAGRAQSYLDEDYDFSLVLGGPLFQILRRLHLDGDHLEHLKLRVIVLTMIPWLPLLFLVIVSSLVRNGSVLSFLRDAEVHVRFLVALPVLVAGESIVHARLRLVVRNFAERSIVAPKDMVRFHRAIDSAMRLRNSIAIECGLLCLVYGFGLWLWNGRVGINTATWYANPGGRWHLTRAGLWYVFVSIPLFQFILLRWYLRIFIWFRFLWQVSRIELHLVPTHPDRSAGLGFLGKSAYAFGPILFAQGAMLAGVIATRIVYRGENLLSFKLQIAGFILFFVVAVLSPLLMFTPQMTRAKRKGLADYGLLAQQYVDRFERRWVVDEPSSDGELLGTADIQSLADLGNSYSMVREMRPVPFGLDDITRLAAATAAPLLPLLFTIFSPEELLMRVVKVLF